MPAPAHIRWIFFDVGDTLLDEREAMFDWCGQLAELLRQRGMSRVTAADVWLAREQAYLAFAPNILRQIMQLLSVPAADAEVWKSATYRHELERPVAGATEVLEALSQRYRLGVIANQLPGMRDRLRAHGWGRLISVCVASAEEGLSKPDPAVFELALARAGCRAEQAVMVGDRIDNDVRPAKALGMMTVRVRQGLSRKQEPRGPFETPDVTIRRLNELPAVLGV